MTSSNYMIIPSKKLKVYLMGDLNCITKERRYKFPLLQNDGWCIRLLRGTIQQRLLNSFAKYTHLFP